MKKLVSYSSSPYKSINFKQLYEETTKESLEVFESFRFDWGSTREVHILGNEGEQDDILQISPDAIGGYYTNDRTWLLIICDSMSDISRWIELLPSQLSCLDVRFTQITKIDLTKLIRLKKLNLSNNLKLSQVEGMCDLSKLQHLDLNFTNIEELPDLDIFPDLHVLNMRNNPINRLNVKANLLKLKYLDISNTKVQNIGFLHNFPKLVRVSIRGTSIKEIPPLEDLTELEFLNCYKTPINILPALNKLKKLHYLNLGYTNISSLENILLPISLRSLVLEGTEIRVIPENIASFSNLRKLDLSNMRLDSLPASILDLELEFYLNKKGMGIQLLDTNIADMDMSILEQPRLIIESWFHNKENVQGNEEEMNPLNEVKVIFLGDGGAGKSLSIQRLLKNGSLPKDFNGEATPGISILSHNYIIESRNILIHFWDFGGQEIMHSMHRMFLTKRTLYVVFVNARDNTQDERARYWLHNIKSFAQGARVLLVINQIDQNPSASVNEPALMTLYPNITKVIRLSAQRFSQDEFNNSFQKELFSEVEKIPYINEPFLDSWNLLKNRLQYMKEYYINEYMFQEICEECGVEADKEVRSSLLEWFSDLGISFCYRDTSALSDYMILRPDWITNAIYIILFNGGCKANNGLIRHEDIHQLLKNPVKKDDWFKGVLDFISYSPVEIEYVLGVIRKFRLSYRLNDETEFIPMLCERNEKPIAKEMAESENALNYIIQYEYLPNNVLHRLMVEMRNDLQHEYVWMSGAVFYSKGMGLKALVKIEDNNIKIYVISANELYPPNVYLGFIRGVIRNINESLGLKTTEKIVYKKKGTSEEFDYAYLLDSYQHGNKIIYSGKLKRNINILDILNQTDGEINFRRNKLVQDIKEICITMQANKLFYSKAENVRNTQVRDMLRSKGYYTSDQTLRGVSVSGKQAGELDLEIMETPQKPIAIFEALNLKSFSSSEQKYWRAHLNKLLDNYNPIGVPLAFLVSYVDCSKSNFKNFWLKYYEYIAHNYNSEYSIQRMEECIENTFSIRSAECVYDYGGMPITVQHICVRMSE
ncbi:COR domain-containing protein [Lachnospiraceae bacterium 42-17]|nr:hypothetical protein [Dorea sp.]